MAMNKKEKEYVAVLEQGLLEAKAMRFTEFVERDLPPPSQFGQITTGYDFNAYNMSVYKACSSSVSHGDGWEKTTSQNPIHLFSTKEKALRALRWAMEKQYSKNLAKIDEHISEARKA